MKDVNSNKNDRRVKPEQSSVDKKVVFDFKVAGVSYKIKTAHDQKTVDELIQYVDQRVVDAMKKTKNGSFQNAAVLAALNIAEELILLKRQARFELDKLEEKLVRLSLEVEQTKSASDSKKSSTKVSWN